MGQAAKLVGKKFGRLTVVAEAGRELRQNSGRLSPQVQWRCLCDCGNELICITGRLTNGNTKSCGCLKNELIGNRSRTHGRCRSPEYNSWCAMKDRCNNQNNQDYEQYGGRGIKICQRWDESFEAFLQDMGLRQKGKNTVERLDANGDYEPSNCRWASQKEQTRNKRNSRRLTFNDETLALGEWAERIGVHYSVLQSRLDRGWPLEAALTTPSQRLTGWCTRKGTIAGKQPGG